MDNTAQLVTDRELSVLSDALTRVRVGCRVLLDFDMEAEVVCGSGSLSLTSCPERRSTNLSCASNELRFELKVPLLSLCLFPLASLPIRAAFALFARDSANCRCKSITRASRYRVWCEASSNSGS